MYKHKFVGIPALIAGPAALTSVADVQYYALPVQVVPEKIMALVSTAVVSTGAVVIEVFARPTHGSTAAQVSLGTLSIPGGATVGSCYYKSVSDKVAVVQAGQEIVFSVTTAAAGGSAAGNALLMFASDEDPEVPLNQANMILSA